MKILISGTDTAKALTSIRITAELDFHDTVTGERRPMLAVEAALKLVDFLKYWYPDFQLDDHPTEGNVYIMTDSEYDKMVKGE